MNIIRLRYLNQKAKGEAIRSMVGDPIEVPAW